MIAVIYLNINLQPEYPYIYKKYEKYKFKKRVVIDHYNKKYVRNQNRNNILASNVATLYHHT